MSRANATGREITLLCQYNTNNTQGDGMPFGLDPLTIGVIAIALFIATALARRILAAAVLATILAVWAWNMNLVPQIVTLLYESFSVRS